MSMVYSPLFQWGLYLTYICFTMASYENSKLANVLGNAPQKIHPPDFSGFDKVMPLISSLKTFFSLSVPLSPPAYLLLF